MYALSNVDKGKGPYRHSLGHNARSKCDAGGELEDMTILVGNQFWTNCVYYTANI
jgi:hypothetical protein